MDPFDANDPFAACSPIDTHELAMHDLAQGVINIDSGFTTIEHGSRIYKAMLFLVLADNRRSRGGVGLGLLLK